MIHSLSELRGLLEKQTMNCPACGGAGISGEQVWHQETQEGGSWWNKECPKCHGSGYAPDPKWAPMLALFVPGPGRQRDAFWNVIPEGALAGAGLHAWPETIEMYDVGVIFCEKSPNQAFVDWAIGRLKDGRD